MLSKLPSLARKLTPKLRSLFSKNALKHYGKRCYPHCRDVQHLQKLCCPLCGKEYPAQEFLDGKEYYQWCTVCDRQKLVEKFGSWTSGNEVLDQFIQLTQLESKWYHSYVEWAEPEEFVNITHLADGGFGSVYKANWSKGRRGTYFTTYRGPEKWLAEPGRRTSNNEVVLKTLNLRDTVSTEFLNEVNIKYTYIDMTLQFV